jgi:hypothetical protein
MILVSCLGERHELALFRQALLVHNRVIHRVAGGAIGRLDDEPIVHARHHLLLAAHHLDEREPLVGRLCVLCHRPRAQLLDVRVRDVRDSFPSPWHGCRRNGKNGGGDGDEEVGGPHGWV